jgi:hypothetical protein
MDAFATMLHNAEGSVMPIHQYCERLPNSVVIAKIWPLLVAPNPGMNGINANSIQCLEVLFKLRSLSSQWKWLVETSTEWAAFRIAKIDSRGLVKRGTSTSFAHRRAIEVFNNVLTLLTTPRKLHVCIPHDCLIAPFPDISDRCLLMLRFALEIEGDGTPHPDVVSDAHCYIPLEVGAIISQARVAVRNRLSGLQFLI